MADFTTHTIDTAPEASKSILEGAKKSLKFVPNLFATMAEAPALLEGYVALSGILQKTDLNETERQIVLMTNNRLNGCEYCMSAHTALSHMGGVAADVIESLRTNTPIKDQKLEALRTFSAVINETRGWPKETDVQAFLNAGYTRQNILEVILGTALKVMSNYTNHIAKTELDDAFKPVAWTPDVLATATAAA